MAKKETEAVRGPDLQRYMGRWCVIGLVPLKVSAQEQCGHEGHVHSEE